MESNIEDNMDRLEDLDKNAKELAYKYLLALHTQDTTKMWLFSDKLKRYINRYDKNYKLFTDIDSEGKYYTGNDLLIKTDKYIRFYRENYEFIDL